MSQKNPGQGAGPWAQAPVPPPIPPPPSRTPPGPSVPAAAAPPRRRAGLAWAIVLGAVAVLLVGVLIGYFAFPPPGLRLPGTVAGVPRLSGGRWDGMTGEMIGAAGLSGHENVAGVYGTGGKVGFAFLGSDAPSAPSENSATIALLAQYFEVALGSTFNVDLTQTVTVRRGDVTYQCTPMGLSSVTGSACAWNDSRTTGFVMSFGASGNAIDLTAAVRNAAVG